MNRKKKISDKIQQIIIDNPQTNYSLEWLNVENAGTKELDYLRQHFHFNFDHLKASMATVFSQRPMVMQQDNYLFLVLHFPTLSGKQIIAGEVEFFIGHGFLVSVHNNNLPALTDMFTLGKKDATGFLAYQDGSSAILLYEILDRLMKSCYPLIDHNSAAISKVDEVIFSGKQKEAVADLLTLRRNIINVKKIMQNHKNILQHLVDLRSSIVSQEQIKESYNQLVEHSKRIWEMLDNQDDLLDALAKTNESLISYRTNNIMKTLTVVTIGLYIFSFTINLIHNGGTERDFWLIGVLAVAIALALVFVFRRKKWL